MWVPHTKPHGVCGLSNNCQFKFISEIETGRMCNTTDNMCMCCLYINFMVKSVCSARDSGCGILGDWLLGSRKDSDNKDSGFSSNKIL